MKESKYFFVLLIVADNAPHLFVLFDVSKVK